MKIKFDKEPILKELEAEEKIKKYKTPKVKSIPRKKKRKARKVSSKQLPVQEEGQEGELREVPQPEPSFSIEQLEKLLAERKAKEYELREKQELELKRLAYEQAKKSAEEEIARIEQKEREKREKERIEIEGIIKQEILVPMIPINQQVFDICPICKMKTKKSKTKSDGLIISQEINCKNKLCNFHKIVNVKV
jgi:hypothetical protein